MTTLAVLRATAPNAVAVPKISIIRLGENTAEAMRQAVRAEAAALAAEGAAILAEAFGGPAYASQALGEAGTTTGDYFGVTRGTDYVDIYLRTGGGSTFQRTAATGAAVSRAHFGQSGALPVVYDDFDRSNRTLDGDTCPTGQVWSIEGAGAGTSEIVDGAFYASDAAAPNTNSYASLDYGQQVTFQGGICRYDRRANAPGVITSLGGGCVMLPQSAAADLVSGMIHVRYTPTAWVVDVTATGPGSFVGIGNGTYNMQPDTDYACGLLIDKPNSRCRVFVNGPGVRVDSGWLSHATIGTLTLTKPTWQISGPLAPTTDAFKPSWRAVMAGPPRKGSRALFEGLWGANDGAPRIDKNDRILRVPEFIAVTNDYHRVYTEVSGSGFYAHGTLHIDVDSSTGTQRASFEVTNFAGQVPKIRQLWSSGTANLVSKVRLSNEVGLCAIDLLYGSAATYPATTRVWFEGDATLANHGFVKSGVAALATNTAELTCTVGEVVEVIGTATTNDWYSIATASSSFGGFSIADSFEIIAKRQDSASASRMIIHAYMVSSVALFDPVIETMGSGVFSQVRISRANGSAVRIDVFTPSAASFPVDITVRRIGKGYSTLGPIAVATAALATENRVISVLPYIGMHGRIHAVGQYSERASFAGLAAAGSTAPAVDNITLVNTTSSTIASHTVTIPTGAVDGQKFMIMTRGAITALTITPPSGQTVANTPTKMAANSLLIFVYRAAGLQWHCAMMDSLITDTGWTAMTGSGSKVALAAAAAGTASAAYVQAELQGALDRVAALEARLKSLDDALFAHRLIGA